MYMVSLHPSSYRINPNYWPLSIVQVNIFRNITLNPTYRIARIFRHTLKNLAQYYIDLYRNRYSIKHKKNKTKNNPKIILIILATMTSLFYVLQGTVATKSEILYISAFAPHGSFMYLAWKVFKYSLGITHSHWETHYSYARCTKVQCITLTHQHMTKIYLNSAH